MKIHKLIALLVTMMVSLSGCGTAGFNGLLNKDVHMKNVTLTVNTPYGMQTLHADELDTRLDKTKSSRPFPVLEKNITTVTGSTNTTSTVSNPPQ